MSPHSMPTSVWCWQWHGRADEASVVVRAEGRSPNPWVSRGRTSTASSIHGYLGVVLRQHLHNLLAVHVREILDVAVAVREHLYPLICDLVAFALDHGVDELQPRRV